MTQEKAKELLPIIQAIADGKDFTLQTPNKNGGWVDCNEVLDSELLYYTYRIKPEENFVYKYGDKFVIMDVRLPLIKESPLFEGSLEECNKWINKQVKEPTCTRDDVLTAEEVEGNYTTKQNAGEK